MRRLERRWDVALSFAGAQRDYVGQVAEALKARGLRCFYDADEQVELWGKYLAEELPAIYARAVGGGCDVRVRRVRRAGLDPAGAPGRVGPGGAGAGEYVLPARFDDTNFPGCCWTWSRSTCATRTPQQFAAMIADKLADLATSAAPGDAGGQPGAPGRRGLPGRCG